ncbi:MAG: TrkA C-terminal domain-containing protein [Candidatus Woesearchaeota archaeon]
MPNIRENIRVMKDLSELIVDLAYSALFLHEPKIAEEVESLYDQIKLLEKETLKLLFRIKGSEEERIYIIELIDEIRDIAGCARRISYLSKGKVVPSIIKEILKETDERIILQTISARSSLAGKKIGEAEVKKHTRAHIIAIKRKGRWIFKVSRETRILPGDLLVAVGSKFAEEPLKRAATS